MKFLLSTVFAAMCASAFGQRVNIAYPPDGTTVSAGSNITVEIDRQSFNSQALEVAIVLGLQTCPGTATCFPASEIIGGVIAYNGPFTPMSFPDDNVLHKPPHQNFTVTIPAFFAPGKAQLDVYHVSLVGATGEPFSETFNITLNVV